MCSVLVVSQLVCLIRGNITAIKGVGTGGVILRLCAGCKRVLVQSTCRLNQFGAR
jgi:hypothetical protein